MLLTGDDRQPLAVLSEEHRSAVSKINDRIKRLSSNRVIALFPLSGFHARIAPEAWD